LDELKATKDPTMGFFESSRLRRELIQKNKRNEELERSVRIII